jgi:hypothetical protein
MQEVGGSSPPGSTRYEAPHMRGFVVVEGLAPAESRACAWSGVPPRSTKRWPLRSLGAHTVRGTSQRSARPLWVGLLTEPEICAPALALHRPAVHERTIEPTVRPCAVARPPPDAPREAFTSADQGRHPVLVRRRRSLRVPEKHHRGLGPTRDRAESQARKAPALPPVGDRSMACC